MGSDDCVGCLFGVGVVLEGDFCRLYHLGNSLHSCFQCHLGLEYVDEAEVERYKMATGNRIQLLRGFMDDVSILTRSIPMARIVLKYGSRESGSR